MAGPGLSEQATLHRATRWVETGDVGGGRPQSLQRDPLERRSAPMWNKAVSALHTGLGTLFRPIVEMAHDHLGTTFGVIVVFALLAVMLSEESADGRADAAKVDVP